MPARKLSIITSASFASFFTMSRPWSDLRLTDKLRLLRLNDMNWVLSPFQMGGHLRVSSPSLGSSILMTSAPMSAKFWVQNGPARVRVRSTTLMFSRG